MFLAALLVEPHPTASAVHKEILYFHRSRCPYEGKGIDHEADQHSISQAGKGTDIDQIDQITRFVSLEGRGLAAALRVSSGRAPRGLSLWVCMGQQPSNQRAFAAPENPLRGPLRISKRYPHSIRFLRLQMVRGISQSLPGVAFSLSFQAAIP